MTSIGAAAYVNRGTMSSIKTINGFKRNLFFFNCNSTVFSLQSLSNFPASPAHEYSLSGYAPTFRHRPATLLQHFRKKLDRVLNTDLIAGATIAVRWPFILKTARARKIKRIRTAAFRVDTVRYPNGLTFIVQGMIFDLLLRK
jgi:hypothetical protein